MTVALLLGGLACGGPTPACDDLDGDGFGPGCERGEDCDPRNAARTDNCDIVPPPDCEAEPFATGCPCLGGIVDCYGAERPTLAHGVCQSGTAICLGGTWGLCGGEVLPSFETCEGTDQDCDGRTDEGVRSPCGGCTPGCIGGVWGEGEAPFEAGGDLVLTDVGSLTLRREERRIGEVWFTNTADGTVSRIDADEAVEVARYFSGGFEPTRVAVDWRGDAIVANRDFDGVSRVRKISSEPTRCTDRDGSESIETSTGGDDVRADDECVVWTVEVGEVGGVARALAVDGLLGPDGGGGGDVWVGLHDGERILHLDGETGAVRRELPTPGFAPYAAAFDASGTLWVASRDGYLLAIDRFSSPLAFTRIEVPWSCFLLYGLDVDAQGRVLVTGFSCDQVSVYDPREDRWSVRATPPSPRGAVVVGTEEGPVAWFAHTDGRVSRASVDPLVDVETFDLQDDLELPLESIGVAATAAGIWVASSRSADPNRGVATRIDAVTGGITAQVPLGGAPHPQGDLSGHKLAGGFVPEAEARHVFPGCADGETTWLALHVDADVPAGTEERPGGEVEVAARWAADEAAIADAAFVVLGSLPRDTSPFELDLPERGVVEVRLVLRPGARDGAPRVHRVGLRHSCPGPD